MINYHIDKLQEAPQPSLRTPLNKYDNKDLSFWRKHQTQHSVLCVGGGETGAYFLSKHQSNIKAHQQSHKRVLRTDRDLQPKREKAQRRSKWSEWSVCHKLVGKKKLWRDGVRLTEKECTETSDSMKDEINHVLKSHSHQRHQSHFTFVFFF